MAVVYIGMGSNLQNPSQQLDCAVASLRGNLSIELLAESPRYSSSAVGPGEQPDYINACLKLSTHLAPEALLDVLQEIENQQGRVRTERWGARTLDLDLLLYDQQVIATERLTVPHPRIAEREFVLRPLHDIDANIQLADGRNITDLLANCPDQGIVRINQ